MDGQRHKVAMGRLRHDVLVGSHLIMVVWVDAKGEGEGGGGDAPRPVCTVAVVARHDQQAPRQARPRHGMVTDSGIGAQSTGNRGTVSNKVGARLRLGAHS